VKKPVTKRAVRLVYRQPIRSRGKAPLHLPPGLRLGTSFDHIAAIAVYVARIPPRIRPDAEVEVTSPQGAIRFPPACSAALLACALQLYNRAGCSLAGKRSELPCRRRCA